MDDELALCEEERVGLNFPGCINDLLHFLLGEIGHVVDELPLIGAIWDHKAESEGVVPDDAPPKVVAFDHLHVLDRLGSDTEHHCKAHRLQV